MQDAPLSYPELSLPDIGGLPAAGTLVLTVNNRLARRLTLELAGLLRAERQVSELPRIVPLSAWLAESANELAFDAGGDMPAYRLDSFATQMVWTEAIRAEEAERVLLDARQAARLAMDADLLMDEWELRVPSGADTDEYKGFARWRLRYREALAELDAEDANQGYARVLDALGQGRLATPQRLVLAGFTEVSPRFARLLDAFAAQGSDIGQWRDAQRAPAQPRRFEAPDQGSEWRAAASWAATQLQVHPTGRYAIVSPQLEAESVFARRVLGQALAGRDGAPALAFNVAVGRPLDEWPMARAALAWLRALAECADGKGCGVQTLGAALLAGHCAGDVRERSRLSAIDARWRRDARQRVSAQEWRRQLSMTPVLAQAWNQAMDIWTQGGRKASCDVWMPRMKAALTALGFPGEAALDSVAYQVMGALGEALGSFSALAPAAGKLGGQAAVRLLESVARTATFQPQRDPSARLDVLGLLEAEGGYWDGVWVLGLTDDVLPASPKPNPLLPLAVLRQARARAPRPNANANGPKACMRRCAAARRDHCQPCAHGRRARTAPVAADRGRRAAGLDARPAGGGRAPAAGVAGRPARPAAGAGRPWRRRSGRARHAGAQPLWAFVRHRLGGRAMAAYADVAAISVRGQFLHRALELAWGMLPDQDALHAAMAEARVEPCWSRPWRRPPTRP